MAGARRWSYAKQGILEEAARAKRRPRGHEDHDLGIRASAVDERATLRINIWESPLI
jgi:hypothetical protein